MNRHLLLLGIIFTLYHAPTFAQQKVRDNSTSGSALPNKDALLELESINKGLQISRLELKNTKDATPLSQHRVGMLVYNIATANDVIPGIYYNNGSRWILIASIDDAKPISYNPRTYELSYVKEDDEKQVIKFQEVVKALETPTELTDNGDGTFSYRNEKRHYYHR